LLSLSFLLPSLRALLLINYTDSLSAFQTSEDPVYFTTINQSTPTRAKERKNYDPDGNYEAASAAILK